MQITFAHGLMGDKSFPYRGYQFPVGNLGALIKVAREEGAAVVHTPYQNDAMDLETRHLTRYPTLSEMGRIFAQNADRSDASPFGHDERGLWIGASVGCAVLLQATLHSRSVTDIILFKPIYDIFGAIRALAEECKAMEEYQRAKQGLQIWQMPISSTESAAVGTFPVSARHINDEEGLRILTKPASAVERLRTAPHWGEGGVRLQNMRIIAADNDPLSPPAAAHAFVRVVQPIVENPIVIDIVQGDHGTNHSAVLAETTREAMRSGWGRQRGLCAA